MWPVFISALGLGLAFSAMPGVIMAEALRRGTAGGMRPVALLRLGSLVGALAWAGIMATGMATVIAMRPLHLLLGVAGAALILQKAWAALDDARRGTVRRAPAVGRGDFTAGLSIALINPSQAAFWLGVNGTCMAGGTAKLETLALFLGGFGARHLLFTLGLAIAVESGRRLLQGAFHRWAQGVCGSVLGLFGLRLLLNVAPLV